MCNGLKGIDHDHDDYDAVSDFNYVNDIDDEKNCEEGDKVLWFMKMMLMMMMKSSSLENLNEIM